MKPSGRALGATALAVVLAWLVGYPLLITLLEALGLPAAFTIAHLAEFASRPDEWMALWRSVWISLASVALAGLVGIPLAFFFERAEFPGRAVLGALVALPVALPPLVGVIAFLFLYGESGFVARGVGYLLNLDSSPWRLHGPLAILLVHAYSMYVYFYLFTRAGLARLDGAMLEAAAMLGAGRWRTFCGVTLPLLRPAILGAAVLTFMTSLSSFSAPYLFGGSFRVMTTQIVASKLNGQLEMARVETLTLAAVAFLGLWAMLRFDPDRRVATTVRGVAPKRTALKQPAVRRLATLVGWGLAVILLLPHATLFLISFVPPNTWTVEAVPPVLDGSNYRALVEAPERLRPVVNSLWMAAASTALAVALGLAAARLSVGVGGRTGGLLQFLVSVPWALPGTVFAIALATTFSVHSPAVGRIVLVGTPWILPLAYLVRSLPLTGRSAFAGVRQLDPALEEAAASLGAGRWRTIRRVLVPILRPALLAGASIAFITALGDFVTSIVLYSYDTRPISIEMLSSLRLQETGVAAVYGVLLMILGAAAFLFWERQGSA